MSDHTPQDRLDLATSARLAKLASRPVDTSRLERCLETAMREVAVEDGVSAPRPAARMAWRMWWRPVTSAAAAILIITAIGWLALDVGTSPAIAAPAALAQIHYDVANGLGSHLEVSSVDEANQLLADQSSGVVPIPDLPGILKSCCLHQHAGATLTCALIERDGQLITVVVADGATISSPHGKSIARDNRQFIAHTANGINMVMAYKGDRWLCVIGDTSTEQLLDVAARITY